MKWLATVLILACSLLIFSDYSSAGSTGDSPPEDGVWAINQPTFVWDEVIEVDEPEVEEQEEAPEKKSKVLIRNLLKNIIQILIKKIKMLKNILKKLTLRIKFY